MRRIFKMEKAPGQALSTQNKLHSQTDGSGLGQILQFNRGKHFPACGCAMCLKFQRLANTRNGIGGAR
jgi:hypothetical protein